MLILFYFVLMDEWILVCIVLYDCMGLYDYLGNVLEL